MKESQIQSEILRFLNNNFFAIKYVGNRAGVPDIISCIKGKFVAFEVKKNQNLKLRPLQKFQQEKIKNLGGLAFKVSSLKEVKKIIEDLNGKT